MMSTLLIIDAMNLIRRIYAVQEKLHGTLPLTLTSTQATSCNAIQKLLNLHRPTHCLCVFDDHVKSWRHKLSNDYKLHRKPIPELLKQGLENIQDEFFKLGIDSLIAKADESNDLIATLASKMAKHGQKCIIVSTDSNFNQLLDSNVIQFDYFKNIYTDQIRVENKMQLPPSKLCDYWALTGISSTNIKGVEGIGAKSAMKLMEEYHSLNAILDSENISKSKLVDKVQLAKNDAILSKRLVTLKTDIELGFNLKDLRYKN